MQKCSNPVWRAGRLAHWAAGLLAILLALNVGTAGAAVHNVTLGANYAAGASSTPSNAQQYVGSGSWYKLYPSAKAELYISPSNDLGTSFTVNEIQSISYHTYNQNNPSPVEFFMAIYTQGSAHGWYEQRLNAEPYLKKQQPYVPVTGAWSAWTTAGPDELTFTDHNNAGNLGFYNAPTLAEIQAAAGVGIDWSTWAANPTQGSATAGPIDYANQTVFLISFQTGSGWSGFDGYIDGITIALTNGETYEIDLEASPDDIYVDDDWTGTVPGTPVGPGQYFGLNAFATVQDGVNAALAGATVHIAAGSYMEQVEIAKNITVLGAGKGLTTIVSPASLTASFVTSPNTNKPIVFVHDATNVEIDDLTVDGNGQGNNNYRFIGVAYWRAGGRLLRVNVDRVEDTPFSGAQHGVAIYANNDDGGPYALEVAECKLTNFQKNGTVLAGTGLTVDVHDCLVTGKGYTTVTAQNGIQISTGATGSIANCAISDMGYSPATYVASGVLVYGTSGAVSVSGLKGPNAITNVQAPISWYDASGTMDGIEVSGGADYGPIFIYNSSATAATSMAPAVEHSLVSRPRGVPFDAEGGAASLRAEDAQATSYTVSVENSCLTGTDVAGTVGVFAYTEGGGLNVTATHNVLHDWDYGLATFGAPAILTANENSIESNATAGYDNTGGGAAQNAEDNWWGAADGPSGAGSGSGDAVLGATVDFTPFLTSGTNLSAGCGFLPPMPTTTVLSTDVNPATCGQKVTLMATVSPGAATGSVEFFDDGNSLGSSPVSGGVATLSWNAVAGYRTLTAQYSGDADYAGSTSNKLVEQVDCAAGQVTTVEVTPCDSLGWFADNLRPGGTVEMTTTYPQSGYGSLEFNTADGTSKADFIRVNGGLPLLATLSALQVDLYRNSSSTAAAHLAPAVRMFVDNGEAVNNYSLLIWEPVYNGYAVIPTDAWNTYPVLKGNFWQRAFRTTGGKTIDLYNRTLADWLAPGFVVDGGGDTSNVVGPNATVIWFEIGVGSGWAGTFHGAADNFQFGFSGVDTVFNFEPEVPTTVALAIDPGKSNWGEKVTLTATVEPSDATGTVEFADQGGTPAFFQGFETDNSGWDTQGSAQYDATRVPSGTNGVTSRSGGFHAEAGQYDLDVDGGSCFTRWGGYNAVFPAGGYVTTVDVYLDVAVAAVSGDKRIDWISAINQPDGNHRRDFVFNLGTEATGFVVSAGNNAGRGSSTPGNPGHDPVHLTQTGWYTLKHRFLNQGGVLVCEMSLIDPNGAVIVGGPAWTRSDPSDVIGVTVGGNRYGWFAAQELPFLAFDNTARTEGSLGKAPIVNGVATLSVSDLAVGSHALVATYQPAGCYLGSSSSKVAHEVNRGPTTVTLASSVNPVKYGTKVTLTATVDPAAASGTVEFFDGATSLGVEPVGGGQATLSVDTLSNGHHSITAVYSGDDCYLGSTSDKLDQVVADQNAPSVTVLAPNGGEILVVGAPTKVSWTAGDDKSVTSVDLCVSRDKGATYQVIVTGLANTGTYMWTVPGPGDNVDATVVYQSLIQVKAHDAAGNTGTDESDTPFAIYDLATETLLSLFQAEPVDVGVELRWQFGTVGLFSGVALERAPAASGPWTAAAGAEIRQEGEVTVALDGTAVAGRSYYYRLVGTLSGGGTMTFGPLEVVAGAAVREFALTSVVPNPSAGPMRIDFALPHEALVRLSVLDVQGRVVAELASGTFRAGRYQAVWNGRTERGAAPAGVYFVRYQAGGQSFVRRVVFSK